MEWMKLTVVAALVSVTGNLVALYLKDFLGARSFERWKARQSLAASFDRYRKPVFRAAEELGGRCYAIAVSQSDWPRQGVGLKLLEQKPNPEQTPEEGGQTLVANESYRRYRFVSDTYRLCCFLGWVELYRKDLGLLDTGAETQSRELDMCLQSIRRDLADGWINTSKDRDQWRDALIFREEQRAIGQRMIAAGPSPGLIDFGTFCEQLEGDPGGAGPARWFVVASRLFSNLQTEREFRLVRMRRLVVHLTELRKILLPDAVPPDHLANAERVAKELTDAGWLSSPKETDAKATRLNT